jgi:hypothetical protein
MAKVKADEYDDEYDVVVRLYSLIIRTGLAPDATNFIEESELHNDLYDYARRCRI